MNINIACIGSGNMGFALMKAAAGQNIKIWFTDADTEKARDAAASIGAAVFNSNLEAAQKADYIFLAVKPQVLQHVLDEIAPAAGQRLAEENPPVIVSMAAGWSIEKIQAAIGLVPVARIMPNTPSLIGKGLIIMAASPQLSLEKAAALENILKGAGVVDRLDEQYIDAATGVSGSGPAFVYLFIEALADGGVQAGLSRDKALHYAAQTVLGSAAMIQETGKHPGELKDMVCSPGGTTIAALAALESGAFRGAVIRAVEAAYKRTKELG